MAKNLKSLGSSQHEDELKYLKEPLLSGRLDSVSQTSGRRSRSRATSSSRFSSSSSVARRKALAEAAAAKQEAEFDRLLAEKERERLEIEAEEERKRQSQRAKFECDKAVLTANKKLAIAEAKLKAIEQSLEEEKEEKVTLVSIPGLNDHFDSKYQTQAWIDAQETFKTVDCVTESPDQPRERIEKGNDKVTHSTPRNEQTKDPSPVNEEEHSPGLNTTSHGKFTVGSGLAGNTPPYGTRVTNPFTPTPMGELTTVNQKLAANLARQNLPKCHPETFAGDVTLFHPWRSAFKAMIKGTDVTPEQEINYLRSYTKGDAQKVVNNYRQRQYRDPVVALQDVWTELERRFGNTAAITNVLIERLRKTGKFGEGDSDRLQAFADVCADVNSQLDFLPGLGYLNYPTAIVPIVQNLPSSIRSKWEKRVVHHAEKYDDAYPGFKDFAAMIQEQARLKNHPNVLASTQLSSLKQKTRDPRPRPPDAHEPSMDPVRRVLKSTMEDRNIPKKGTGEEKYCPFHQRKGHTLSECKAFESETLEAKNECILRAGLCFRCLSRGHRSSDCTAVVKCTKCGDDRHPTILHKDKTEATRREHGEELQTACTSVCQDPSSGGVSCSKIVLVDIFSENQAQEPCRVYAILDDQSNASMISPNLADKLGATGPNLKYFLSTCSGGKEEKSGRRVSGVVLRSMAGKTSRLPQLVECANIPQDKREIVTPEMARQFPHLKEIAEEIPPYDPKAKVEILIGRDAPELLKIRESKNGPKGAPWAQKLDLGWTVSGQMCLDRVGGPIHISAHRTAVEYSDKPLGFPSSSQTANRSSANHEVLPCPNHFKIKEQFAERGEIEADLFRTTPDDNTTSLSQEDRRFLEIMETKIHKNQRGNWEMPLPFPSSNIAMPNNRSLAVNRLNSLLRTFKKKPKIKEDYLQFMGNVFNRGHAVPVPQEEMSAPSSHPEMNERGLPDQEQTTKTRNEGRIWYLPHFGVYHPKKPDQIRVVFDSSAEFQGVSLNKELLPGPDLMNSLVGVLIRFRQENVAAMCDIEQMFHSFHVAPEHQNFLRFLWYKDNDPSKEIIENKMTVHLFGNGPSPAIATFGLRKTADDGEEKYGKATRDFVHRNFYVDDGLTSCPTESETICLVRNAQAMLATANLRLHKVVSNSVTVMEALPAEDRAKSVKDLDLRRDVLPTQRSLGVHWDIEKDHFTFRVLLPEKPFTRRGVLSIVNSVYDPLGLASPVVLEGKLILQQLVLMGKKANNNDPLGWDDPLPENMNQRWSRWRDALPILEKVAFPRCYHPKGFGTVERREIHAFCDASKDAIGTAVYLREINSEGDISVSLLFGRSKIAPTHSTSIPRLELCSAVLATKAVRMIRRELDVKVDEEIYYSDSKVVLGYIQNESRRFYVYVANRVQMIRNTTEPSQWRYIDTASNPADLATRCLSPDKLLESRWTSGPEFLWSPRPHPQTVLQEIPLDESDPEVKREVVACITRSQTLQELGTSRFNRFSSWSSVKRAVASLIRVIKSFKERNQEHSRKPINHLPPPSAAELERASEIVVKSVQKEAFTEEFKALSPSGEEKTVPKSSNLLRLDPFLDPNGLLRVGGRLRNSTLEYQEKHPVLLPKGHHVSKLIIRHFHEKVHHQGRQITSGAVREAGYWVVGAHRMISSLIESCVTCKKLRGAILTQHMANLPSDRLETSPPFSNVGFDVFGPWEIATRRLRGGAANAKRWGLVFTCLSSRAIHIELLETMDASSFICALRRFLAIRGPVEKLRCDQGTNFVGGKSQLDDALSEMDQTRIQRFTAEQGVVWIFNPPHASHFGGAWERQIGTIRRVLDAMLLEIGRAQLTHELLVTLMAEVTGIVNSRPIATIPSDIDEPQPLTPAMLLTMKTRPLAPTPGHFVRQDLYARNWWRKAQYLADQFWVRWRKEYLQNLQNRTKWEKRERNLAVGDIVLVKEDNAHRNDWLLGKIIEVTPSSDGKVRRAKVTSWKEGSMKTYDRPICSFVLLLKHEEEA